MPVQPRKGKDTKKFNKDLKRINDLGKKLRDKMEQIEEVEKKKEEKLKNTVAEMSGEPKESKKQVRTYCEYAWTEVCCNNDSLIMKLHNSKQKKSSFWE